MTAVTFGAWLDEQARNKPKGDPVGELARYWLTIKGTDRVRALPSIEKRLEAAGAWSAGWKPAWDEATAIYRGQRTGSLASGDLRLAPPLPGQEGYSPPPAAPLPGYMAQGEHSGVAMAAASERLAEADGIYGVTPPATMETIQATLDAHTRFLAAIAVKLGLSATMVTEIAAQTFGEPFDWRAMAQAAVHEMEA